MEYQKRRNKEKPAFQIRYSKMRFQENPEILTEYQKRDTKKSGIQNFLQQAKQGPFAEYAIKACINAVVDYLSMKNIIFCIQNCITQ